MRPLHKRSVFRIILAWRQDPCPTLLPWLKTNEVFEDVINVKQGFYGGKYGITFVIGVPVLPGAGTAAIRAGRLKVCVGYGDKCLGGKFSLGAFYDRRNPNDGRHPRNDTESVTASSEFRVRRERVCWAGTADATAARGPALAQQLRAGTSPFHQADRAAELRFDIKQEL